MGKCVSLLSRLTLIIIIIIIIIIIFIIIIRCTLNFGKINVLKCSIKFMAHIHVCNIRD